MPLALDFLKHVINVKWGAGKRFLYSGADGMFGSKTGETWEEAPESVAATSLAFVDGVWIASGPDGCWRSEDGARTWETTGGPTFKQVAAMKPERSSAGLGKGVFAGWMEDEEGDNQLVYTSHDLGKTWSVALTIAVNGGSDDGFEGVSGLSGCGGALFVCTIWQSGPYHHGDGKIYSSLDGHSFSSQTVFGPGNVTLPDDPHQYPRNGFTAAAVGHDAKTGTYIAVGEKSIQPEFGVQDTSLIHTLSSSPSFETSEGSVDESGTLTTPGGGEQIGSVPSATGGNGKHVTGSLLITFAGDSSFTDEKLRTRFIPGGSEVLQTVETLGKGFLGSFCFNDFAELGTDTDDDSVGAFACVAFDDENTGGVYLASAGGTFVLKHGGSGISLESGATAGAVAVGDVSFLDGTT